MNKNETIDYIKCAINNNREAYEDVQSDAYMMQDAEGDRRIILFIRNFHDFNLLNRKAIESTFPWLTFDTGELVEAYYQLVTEAIEEAKK